MRREMQLGNSYAFGAESDTCIVVWFSNQFTRHCQDDIPLHSGVLCGRKFWIFNCSEEGMFTFRRLVTRFSDLGISGRFIFTNKPLNDTASLHWVSLISRFMQNARFVFVGVVPSPNPGKPFGHTGLRSLEFGHSDRRPHCINRSESNWSLLLDSLLLMIKDKLNIIDDINLTAVCRDWWIASNGYSKQYARDAMPWVMQWSDPASRTVLEFISVERNKKFTLDLPEFRGALLVFSREGWILLKKVIRSDLSSSVVLVNPSKKATVKMPELTNEAKGGSHFGCFTTRDGSPHCVAFLRLNRLGELTVGTAFPGDQTWTEHKYIPQSMEFRRPTGLLIVGQNIYCFDGFGDMIIYNMSSGLWKEVTTAGLRNLCGIVELEGRLLLLDWALLDFVSTGTVFRYQTFRYNETDTLWERLENGDMKDMSWFTFENDTRLVVRRKGLKAYLLREKEKHNYFDYFTCLVHDLVDGSKENLELSRSLNPTASWVMLG